ncbi:MAG TPA: MBOAT family O-acyltransferase [Desulfobacterales bacterium]
MIFSSPIFLFGFLPAVLLGYFLQRRLLPRQTGNAVLLLFSGFFYLYGAAEFILILLLSTMIDYWLGRAIERSAKAGRFWLALAIFENLGLLVYFKYAGFFAAELSRWFLPLPDSSLPLAQTLLPIGISFITFQKISYAVDVYRGHIAAEKNPLDFFLYVTFFPQLNAGPIVRFGQIREQLKRRTETWDGFYQGVLRFIWGLAKMVVVAGACAQVADAVFALPPELLDTKMAWLGAIAYTLQIYFDFSAYTDMAIGLGLLFGFRLPENFRRPYSALSVTDFWRRWHITLSTWFRDYLYVPLGGNRRGSLRTYLNLTLVFVLCGIWHGANWTFLVWGMYHGLLLVVERFSGIRSWPEDRLPVVRRLVTAVLITLGWVVFRSETFAQAMQFLTVMFNGSDLPLPYELLRVLNYRNITFMTLALAVFFLPRGYSGIGALTPEKRRVPLLAGIVFIFLMLPYCAALVVEHSSVPFIYFKF